VIRGEERYIYNRLFLLSKELFLVLNNLALTGSDELVRQLRATLALIVASEIAGV
jgi:hypothetical protein